MHCAIFSRQTCLQGICRLTAIPMTFSSHILISVPMPACRGQGEALTVDRHHLYQALYRALGHSSLGSLEPANPPASAPHQQVDHTAATCLASACAGPA